MKNAHNPQKFVHPGFCAGDKILTGDRILIHGSAGGAAARSMLIYIVTRYIYIIS